METTVVLGVLGGLIVTVVFVAVVILLLKIVRAIMLKGVQNQTLTSLLEYEEGDEENVVGGDGGDAIVDNGGGVDNIVGDGANALEDKQFWSSVHVDDTFSYPSPARLVKSSTPLTYIIRSSTGNKTAVYSANGTSLALSYVTTNHPINDIDDTRLFLVHYFDLAHFEPDDKDKPVDERRIRYVVFESVVHRGYFIHYETLADVHDEVLLKLTNKRPPVKDITTTDDRFFKMSVHDKVGEMDRVKLEHMSTNQWLSVGDGFTSPRPALRVMSSGASDVDLFFIEVTLLEI